MASSEILANVSDENVEAWCRAWWASRDIYADQSLFQPKGRHYSPGGFGATRCWLWQMAQFLQSTFEHEDDAGQQHSFRPCDLTQPLQQRFIGKLGLEIGLFYRDMEKLYKKYHAQLVPALPRYYDDFHAVCPELQLLVDHTATIQEEVKAAMKSDWIQWPEEILYKSESNPEGAARDWRVFPFLYTFPAKDPAHMKFVDKCCALCPRTVALLKQIPGIRTALFSKLGPSMELGQHMGWADLSNYILRTHLGLIVPGNGKQCGTRVEGEARYHAEGELIIFDDSLLHMAFNETKEERVVLIVDVVRPPHIPPGRSNIQHTAELDDLLSLSMFT